MPDQTAVLQRKPASGVRVGVTGLFLANGVGFGAWAASVPAVKQTLSISSGALGGALLAVALGAMLAMPLTGWLGARRVPRLLSGTGVFLMLALPWPGFADSLPVLAATLLVFGAASGALDVCMNARAAEVERGWGRAIMSSFHAAFSLGGLVGTCVVAASSWLGFGVAGGLLAAAVLVGVAVLAHGVLDPAPDLATAEVGQRIAWPRRALAGIGLLCLLAFMTEGGIGDWSGVFLAQVARFPPQATPAGFAAFSATMIVGRLTGDFAVRRFGAAAMLGAGGLIAMAGFALAIAMPALGPLGFGLVGLGTSNMAPVLFSASARAGSAASTGVAAAATLGYAGMLLGPPLIGILADFTGLRAALGVLVAAMAAVALGARRVIR